MILAIDYIGYPGIPVYSDDPYIVILRFAEWVEYHACPPYYNINKVN